MVESLLGVEELRNVSVNLLLHGKVVELVCIELIDIDCIQLSSTP